jgi:hypothetical protein
MSSSPNSRILNKDHHQWSMWHLHLAIITNPTIHLMGITEGITEDMVGAGGMVMVSASLVTVTAITRTLPSHP